MKFIQVLLSNVPSIAKHHFTCARACRLASRTMTR
jgi:hypothetical protein